MDDRAEEPASSVVSAVVTEHFVLQSARGAATSEAAGRLTGLLATVSGALVAAGFIADTPAASAFFAVSIPFVVLLGVLTYRRLIEISIEDVLYVRAIQDIRTWYATALPAGLPASMTARSSSAPLWSLAPTRTAPGLLPLLFTTASTAALVTSVILGAGAALLVTGLGLVLAAVTAVVVATGTMILFGVDQSIRFRRIEEPAAPRPDGPPDPAPLS